MWTTFDLVIACVLTWIVTSCGVAAVLAMLMANERRDHRSCIPAPSRVGV